MKNNVRHDIPRTSKKIIVECDRKITTFPRFWRIYSIQLKRKARKERDSYLRSHETRLRNPKREGYESREKSYFTKNNSTDTEKYRPITSFSQVQWLIFLFDVSRSNWWGTVNESSKHMLCNVKKVSLFSFYARNSFNLRGVVHYLHKFSL